MSVRPNSYKLVCPKCGYSKVVAPKSDCLSPRDMINMNPTCSKCGEKMERKNTNILDDIFTIFTK